MIIQPIVEGPGDISAVPILIRRICYELECCLTATVAAPMKVSRSKMVQESHFRHYVRIANSQPGCKLILFFIDADDDCPKSLSDLTRPWIAGESLTAICEIIVIPREYECWFIAALESLRGVHGIIQEATSHNYPEAVRNPKAILTDWMEGSSAYHETADQPAFTEKIDLRTIHERCSAFRRLVSKIRCAANGCNVS